MNTMTPLRFTMRLAYLFLGSIAQMANLNLSIYVHQESVFYSANVGDSVTLRCFYEGDAVMFDWYKQTLGQKPMLISTFYKHEKSGTFHNEFKNNRRYRLDTGNNKNHLTISDLCVSDSATYYCIGSKAYDFEFVEGATVSIKGSGFHIQALVHQSASETIQPGGSVTLNCTVHTGTCDGGEHSVYWFKNSEESHPGLIYTHGGRTDQCERKANTQTHTCVYNLPMKSLNLSHAGTYYCAVASCGHILFGNRTKLDFEPDVDSLGMVYFLSGALAFSCILLVLLTIIVYKMNKRKCFQSTESQARFSAPTTTNHEGYRDADSLHYAAVGVNLPDRARRNNTNSECVYSGVKQ